MRLEVVRIHMIRHKVNGGNSGRRTWGVAPASKLCAAKKREEDLLALWQVVANQVKYIRIFLLFLNSELCPGVTPCPKLPPFTLHLIAQSSNPAIYPISSYIMYPTI